MKRQRFGQLLSSNLRNGISAPSHTRGSGTYVINMGEFFANPRITLPSDTERAPLPSDDTEWLLAAGDLLFARQSLTLEGAGKCGLILPHPEPRTWESHLIRARLSRDVAVPAYYYYYFRSPQGRNSMSAIVQQVAAAGIRGSDLAQLEVPVPALPEQQAIAEVLGALDDKIAANRALVTTMEDRLRAIFSLNIRTGPVRRLDEVLSFNPPRHISSSLAPQIPMQSLPSPSMVIDCASMAAPNGGAKFTNGDTLLARITPCLENGKTGFVSNLDDGAVGFGSTEYIVMRSIDPNPLALSYFVATDPVFRKEAIRRMIGTSGRQRVSARDLSSLEFPITNRTEILQSFGREAAEQMELGRRLVKESATLASLRDTLLPALMDETIRVKDAEATVARSL